MKKTVSFLLSFVLTLLTLPAIPAQAANRTWTVIAGGATKDVAVASNAFHPRTIEVAVGDTVAWKFQGFHTVTFLSGTSTPSLDVEEGGKRYLNPQILFPFGEKTYRGRGYRNSGIPPLDPAALPKFGYSLTFTEAGSYQYICLVHGPAMSGIVVVKASAIGSPSAAASQGQREQAATLKAGQAAFVASKVQKVGNDVVVSLRGDPKAGYSILRFTRDPLVVNLGATVTWKMADQFEIHTVTFLSGAKPPDLVLVEPQKQGPPKLRFNPKVAAPAGPIAYDGTGYVNSGILFTPGPGSPNAPSSYSLTFLKAGKYEYVCIVHLAEGMKGRVIVQ